MSPENANSKKHNGEKKRKRDNGERKSKSKKPRTTETVDANESQSLISPFHVQTSSLFVPLAPISQNYPIEGLCAEHLSPLILTYYPPLNGVILSYSNPRLSEKPFGDDSHTQTMLKSIDEYAVSWAWATAEFLVFRAEKGTELEGYVNLQNEGHLGIVCWNLFNASIERKRLPKDWVWKDVGELEEREYGNEGYAEDAIGHYVNEDGEKIEGVVKFRVTQIESSHDRERGFLSIEGTMLSSEQEAELVESGASSKQSGREATGRRLGAGRSLGATILGIEPEKSIMEHGDGEMKHRTRY